MSARRMKIKPFPTKALKKPKLSLEKNSDSLVNISVSTSTALEINSDNDKSKDRLEDKTTWQSSCKNSSASYEEIHKNTKDYESSVKKKVTCVINIEMNIDSQVDDNGNKTIDKQSTIETEVVKETITCDYQKEAETKKHDGLSEKKLATKSQENINTEADTQTHDVSEKNLATKSQETINNESNNIKELKKHQENNEEIETDKQKENNEQFSETENKEKLFEKENNKQLLEKENKEKLVDEGNEVTLLRKGNEEKILVKENNKKLLEKENNEKLLEKENKEKLLEKGNEEKMLEKENVDKKETENKTSSTPITNLPNIRRKKVLTNFKFSAKLSKRSSITPNLLLSSQSRTDKTRINDVAKSSTPIGNPKDKNETVGCVNLNDSKTARLSPDLDDNIKKDSSSPKENGSANGDLCNDGRNHKLGDESLELKNQDNTETASQSLQMPENSFDPSVDVEKCIAPEMINKNTAAEKSTVTKAQLSDVVSSPSKPKDNKVVKAYLKKNNNKENSGIDSVENLESSNKISSNDNSNLKSLVIRGKSKATEKKKLTQGNIVHVERKRKFKEKISSGSELEVKKMTMFDLIYFNPADNPLPRRSVTPSQKKKARRDSVGNQSGTSLSLLEEQDVDDVASKIESSPPTPSAAIDEEMSENNNGGDEKDEGEAVDLLAPQVKIGPDGNIIIDEKSLTIQTTAAKHKEYFHQTEIIEETEDTANDGRWSKKTSRSLDWTPKETARFYQALSTVGTDFQLMAALISWRSRAELKSKFKKEERLHRSLVDKALRDRTQFDFATFEGEDFDPVEERRVVKELEKEGAKKRKLEQQEALKLERLERKKLKLEEKEEMKLRKKILREENKKNRAKKTPKQAPEKNSKGKKKSPSVRKSTRKVRKKFNLDSDDENDSECESFITDSRCSSPPLSVFELELEVVGSRVERNVTILETKSESMNEIPNKSSDVIDVSSSGYISNSSTSNYVPNGDVSSIDSLDLELTDADVMLKNNDSNITVKQASPEVKIIENLDDSSSILDLSTSQSIATNNAQSLVPQDVNQNALTWIVDSSKLLTDEFGSSYVEIDYNKNICKVPVPQKPQENQDIFVVALKRSPETDKAIFHVYLISRNSDSAQT